MCHTEGPFPILLFFHGGGWVICSLDTHDNTCRALANRARCLVISVDYRLAPEAEFPAAVRDAYAAAQWAVENAGDLNGDPTRVAVGGDSAGGNLSAALALMARDEGGPPLVYQLLIYPVTDVHTFDRDSYREYTEGYVVTREEMAWYRDHYLQDVEEARDPYVSPLLCPDLSGLPAAHVVTAEYDVLRDEGEAYARRLKEAGNAVTCTRYNGMVHGFMSMDGAVDKAGVALTEVSDKLCLALYAR
jgi:acetyl esterase